MTQEERFKEADKLYNAEKYDKAVPILEVLADEGYAPAQALLAYCYYSNAGVKKNIDKALEWWRKAADQGYAPAQSWLGDCYYYGNGVPRNYIKAAEWFDMAARQGHETAKEYLQKILDDGKIDQQKAEDTAAQKAAADEEAKPVCNKAKALFDEGKYEQALVIWNDQANGGYALAQFWLGKCFYDGKGVTKDFAKAAEWWKKAADQGHTGSRKLLDNMKSEGKI